MTIHFRHSWRIVGTMLLATGVIGSRPEESQFQDGVEAAFEADERVDAADGEERAFYIGLGTGSGFVAQAELFVAAAEEGVHREDMPRETNGVDLNAVEGGAAALFRSLRLVDRDGELRGADLR